MKAIGEDLCVFSDVAHRAQSSCEDREREGERRSSVAANKLKERRWVHVEEEFHAEWTRLYVRWGEKEPGEILEDAVAKETRLK